MSNNSNTNTNTICVVDIDSVVDNDNRTEREARHIAEKIKAAATAAAAAAAAATIAKNEGDKTNNNNNEILETAQQHKQQGNIHFNKKEWKDAIKYYSKAIEIHPEEYTYYSNRSACYIQLNDDVNNDNDNDNHKEENLSNALHDAIITQILNPTWSKGYYRIAIARYELGKYELAATAAYQGLFIHGKNHKNNNNVVTKSSIKNRDELKRLLQKCAKLGRDEYQQQQQKNKTTREQPEVVTVTSE